MNNAREVSRTLAPQGRRLREMIPEVYAGFVALDRAALSDGVVSARTKQLVALAIAVTRECDGCIASHARGAAREHATREEVAEVLGVALMMNGGPGTVWAPRAFAAFEEFLEPAPETPS
jgi:AhpD family alkylhydroperoxidase